MTDKLLCECEDGRYPGQRVDDDWHRFDSAAKAAGHASGFSAANDRGLWGLTVGAAIAEMVNDLSVQEVSDGCG